MTPDFTLGPITLDALPATPIASEMGGGINQVYSVDLDADGASDLLIFGGISDTGQVQPAIVAFGDGHGGFVAADASRFPALGSVHVREVAFTDFNGDGDLDVFVADHGWDVPPYSGAQNRLYLSNGDGTWRDATASLPQKPDFTHSVATGDLDGDGDSDILVNNSALPSYVYVLLNDGAGHFTPDTSFLPTGPGQLLDPTVRNALSATVADLDHDGLSDIVLGSSFVGPGSVKIPIQVLWSDAGAFDTPQVTSLPMPALTGHNALLALTYDIQPMDVNFDGYTDLVCAWTHSVEGGGYELQVLVNDGARGFTDRTADFIPQAAISSGTGFHWVQFLVPADLNADGRTDFFVDARGGPKPADFPIALIHQPDGTFAVFDQASTPWILSGPQWAWWPGGTGFVQIDRPQTGYVGADMFAIAFADAGPHWVGGTAGADLLTGTSQADEMAGFGGNDTLDGGAGIDFARYASNRSAAQVHGSDASWTVSAPGAGTDTLVDVERIRFDDGWLALDVDGAAGQVARIIGTLFGAQSLGNAVYVGVGLGLLDAGTSSTDLIGLALSVIGPRANDAFVRSVYQNVTGSAPTAGDLALYVGLLDSGEFTQQSLAALACDTQLVAQRIDLEGLAATGLGYVLG